LTEIDESATEPSHSQLGPEPQPPDGERKPPLPRFNLVAWLRDRYLSVDPRWLGLFRVCYGLILISELVNRWFVARLFYSNDGLLPNHFSLFRPMGDDLFSLYHVASSVNEVHVAFALTLLVFVLFTVGYKTRLFHVLSLICITSLHSRNLFNENGGSVVVNILGLWTLFLPLGSRFSVDAVLASLKTRSERSSAELNDRSWSLLNERARTLLLGGGHVRVFGVEDHLRLLALRMLRGGAWRAVWLCDLAVMVESTARFDWDSFLSGDARRSDWATAGLLLARDLLGADLRGAPAAVARRALPHWLARTVLREWSLARARPGSAASRPQRGPGAALRALRARWPNGVEATVGLGAPFNAMPRLPLQVAACVTRAARAGMPAGALMAAPPYLALR